MPYSLDEQMHVAELAGLAVYARAVLSRAIGDEPGVLSLRLDASLTFDHAIGINVELCDAKGNALGGFGL